MFSEYPDIITVDHLTKMLKIGKSSAYSLLQNNQIRHVKVGRKYIIPKQAVLFFVGGLCYTDSQIIDGGLQLVKKGEGLK